MLEFEGVSLDVNVGIGILKDMTGFWSLAGLFEMCFWGSSRWRGEFGLLYKPRDCGEYKMWRQTSWLCHSRDSSFRVFCCTSQKLLQKALRTSQPTILRGALGEFPLWPTMLDLSSRVPYDAQHCNKWTWANIFPALLDPAPGTRSPPRHFTVPVGRLCLPRLPGKSINLDAKTLTHKANRKLRTSCSGQWDCYGNPTWNMCDMYLTSKQDNRIFPPSSFHTL